MNVVAKLIGAGLVALPLLVGCRFIPEPADPLPTVAWDDVEDALQILKQRQAAIQNVQAECVFRITPPGEKTQTLDGAIVMQDDRLRLRTWKLNQTVFDLTVNETGTWVSTSKEMRDRAPDAQDDLGRLAEQLRALLRGPDYDDMYLSRHLSLGEDPNADSWLIAYKGRSQVWIDSDTLAPRVFVYAPGLGSEPGIEIMPTYTTYGGLYWYHRVAAEGSFGTIDITFRNVELNGELNPRAFRQPRRAIRADDTEAGQP